MKKKTAAQLDREIAGALARKPKKSRGTMTVLGYYTLDMDRQGALVREPIVASVPGEDYGADPVGDGTFRMVPSGDVVSFEERNRRLARFRR